MIKLIVLFLSVVPLVIIAQVHSEIEVSIQIEKLEQNLLAISGIYANQTSYQKKLQYTFNVQKRTVTGNTNNNKQSGEFSVKPGEQKILSKTIINFEPQDFTRITLSIYDDKNILVAKQEKLLDIRDLSKN